MLARMLASILEEHNELEKAIHLLTRPRDMDNIIKLFMTHAVDEERLMQQANYSDYLNHRYTHDYVINQLKNISLDQDYANIRFSVSTIILNHIKEHDMVFLNGLELFNANRS